MKCFKFQVKGRVQGVCFRASTVDFVQTSGLNITGYVKNMPSGDVEVLAQGEEQALDQLFYWLKKGPSMSKVLEVKLTSIDKFSNYNNFKVVY